MGAEADERPHGAAVVVDGFGLKGPRGWAFREVSFRAGPGALVAIEGPSGSGRTCLLLALTGRMRAKEGTAEVGGLPLPKKMAAVRRISALGHVPGVSELDPAFTVAEHLGERAMLQRRFDGSVRTFLRRPSERRASARARIDEAVAAAGLDLAALPKGERTSVRDLERLEALRLSIALALIGRPRLLAVDDTDLKLSDADRAEAWALLRSVADSGTTVLAVCSEAPEGALRITTLDATAAADTATDTDKAAAGTTPGTEARTGDAEPEARTAADTAEADTGTGTGTAADTADTADTKTIEAPASGKAIKAEKADKADSDLTEDTTEEGAADALAETGRA
ncbi:ATP-binding cassette domain-containing protein [Streptomyces sp. NBC_00233]|uniref:ATP-binding cassette domain-containing protein n=1 Tax=Streptomyces sp. NBC_00233 TaxID=2975686 RepID=UPI0022559603|nr:ATP-binding cassette domain-containing protein [Streptomyces sp. NBC_00233]MCX5225683.1 ATP-binding cassette domain-containing protein [Streptomyces sp. NBC_00233]